MITKEQAVKLLNYTVYVLGADSDYYEDTHFRDITDKDYGLFCKILKVNKDESDREYLIGSYLGHTFQLSDSAVIKYTNRESGYTHSVCFGEGDMDSFNTRIIKAKTMAEAAVLIAGLIQWGLDNE